MSSHSETSKTYPADRTAILLVDPYNDFLSEGGKLWPRVQEIAREVDLHEHLRLIIAAARVAGLPIFVVPHHRYGPNDLNGWLHPTPYMLSSAKSQVFARGDWGGEWAPGFEPQPEDIVVKEHWSSSGFANTDLDMLLKQKAITHVILIGMVANTCIETTGKFASEFGYHVTLVRDATAAFSREAMHAAHEINASSYAHALVGTSDLLRRLPEAAKTS